jgi:uncharacterized repeat protein (TIGR01451 family)
MNTKIRKFIQRFNPRRVSDKKTNAQGMVEFALVLPILLMVVMGIIEFGRLIAFYSALTLSSREAARYAASVGEVGGTPHYADCPGIRAAAARVGLMAGIAPTTTDVLISYDTGPSGSSVSATCPPGVELNLGDRIVVTVNKTFTVVAPFVPFPPLPMTSTSARTILKDIHIEGTPASSGGGGGGGGESPTLSASKRDYHYIDLNSDGLVSPGDTLEYEIEILNSGDGDAYNVVFTDTPDPNTTLVVGSVTGGTVNIGNSGGDTTVDVTVGTIASGTSATVTFLVTINFPFPVGVTEVSNQGIVSALDVPEFATDDPDEPDYATITPVFAIPELEATKIDALLIDADGNSFPSPGDTLRYSIAIVNIGTGTASNVVFTDSPDGNTSLVVGSVTTNLGTVSVGNSGGDTSVQVDVGMIFVGTTVNIGFDVTIDDPFPSGVTNVSNQGMVASTELSDVPTDDPGTGAIDDPTVTVVSADPEFTATKKDVWVTDADGSGNVSPGDTLRYEIKIDNTGNGSATNIVFRDTPDINTALVVGSVTKSQGTVTKGNSGGDTQVEVDVGTMVAGASVTIQFQVTIDIPFPGGVTQVSNQGIVLCDELANEPTDDPDTGPSGDATKTNVIVVTTAPILTASKVDNLQVDSDGSGDPSPGDTIRYVITINNTGDGNATGVVFSDTPDVNTALVVGSVTTNIGSVTTGNGAGHTSVVVNVGTIPPAGSVTINFNVTVDNPFPSGVLSVLNQGTVASNELPNKLTDDPAVGGASDPTATAITIPVRRCEVSLSLSSYSDGKYTFIVDNTGNVNLVLYQLRVTFKGPGLDYLEQVNFKDVIWIGLETSPGEISEAEWNQGTLDDRKLNIIDPEQDLILFFHKSSPKLDDLYSLNVSFKNSDTGEACDYTKSWMP